MSKKNILSIILALIPISYVLGTFALNLNILIIILSGFYLFFKGNKMKVNDLDKIVILFFAYILFTGVLNTIEINYIEQPLNKNYYIINKSFFYLRYLILYFSIRLIISKNLINFKIVLSTYSIIVLFVSIDIIIQFFNGKDIFGIESPFVHKNTGPFFDEAIAGGFIQRFSLFSFFSFVAYGSIKNDKLNIYLLSVLFILIITSIIFSGNRMPLILFLISILIIFLTTKTLRRYFVHIFILIFLVSLVTINSHPRLKQYYSTFYSQSEKIISLYSYKITGIGSDLLYEKRPNYIHEFDAGYSTFKLNKFIGGGVKSFRFNCPKRKIESINERTTCNMHPHNYFLEILTDLGIFGLLIFLSIVFLVFFKTIKQKKYGNHKYVFLPFFYVFFMEIFPFKSSGSFFTTNNSIIIFVTLGVVVSLLSQNDNGGPTGNRTPIR